MFAGRVKRNRRLGCTLAQVEAAVANAVGAVIQRLDAIERKLDNKLESIVSGVVIYCCCIILFRYI